MGYNDILLLPFFLLLVYFVAIIYRNKHYEKGNKLRKYFLPALTVKVFGAIAVGFIYQFYYKGGDTFYFYQGSEVIWDIFSSGDILGAFKILFTKAGDYQNDTFIYTQKIWAFKEPASFLVVKTAAFLSFFCMNTYLVIALFFATFSFIALWRMYELFISLFPHLHKQLAIAILFMPSVVFWGSGIFKDTITLACLAWLTVAYYRIFMRGEKIIINTIILVVCSYFIVTIKTYIFLSILPALLIWTVLIYWENIETPILRIFITFMLILFTSIAGYFIIIQLGEEFERYAIDNVLDTAQSMQRWHGYVSQRQSDSGYNIGETNPSVFGVLSKIPASVNVTLFRPYIWEARNILMLFAAIESTFIMILSIWILFKTKVYKLYNIILGNPTIAFCLIFASIFAFAVGFSSYNFGALMRYKIPCIPFYMTAVYLIMDAIKKKKLLIKETVKH